MAEVVEPAAEEGAGAGGEWVLWMTLGARSVGVVGERGMRDRNSDKSLNVTKD